MRVIVITEKDAANMSLAKICDSLIASNHEVRIYATYLNERVLRCFDEKIERYNVKQITDRDIEWCDIIICSTLVSIFLPITVFFAKKPIFTHNYLMNRQINWGGDICFAPTQATVASDYDVYLNYSYIGIGEPKYDRPDMLEQELKRFLFIDSGHYPFSFEGKQELARTLLHICDKYPDYELVIKPRFLPDDKIITHRNNVHLYEIIRQEAKGILPKNMIMLTVHEDLQKLIDQSSTVICMYTTAFVGAVVSGKGLIILENLKTMDVYDIRHKTYMRNRENMISSGALVDYKEIDKLLPDGAKTDSKYLDFLLEEKNHVADKIVEVCGYLWEEFYNRGLFPRLCDSTYKKFKQDYLIDDNMTWDEQISRRCHDYIFLKALILIDFHVKAKLDIDYVINKIKALEDKDGIIDKDIFREYLGSINDIRDNCIIENREKMLKDDIDAGVLLNAYYLQKKYDEIINFPLDYIAAFNMYRAFVAVDTLENDSIAKNHLIEYFEKCSTRKWILEISDMSNNKFKAYKMLIDILKCKKQVADVKYYMEQMKEYYQQTYFLSDFTESPLDQIQRTRYDYIVNTMNWIEDHKE